LNALRLRYYIPKILGSNLGPDTGCPERGLTWFISLQANVKIGHDSEDMKVVKTYYFMLHNPLGK
jgi:hypothetical protein